jgi:hypothetical protein
MGTIVFDSTQEQDLMQDFAKQMTTQLDGVASVKDFCKDWKTTWRGIAVAAQSVLTIFFPPGAKVLGFLIGIADTFCATP